MKKTKALLALVLALLMAFSCFGCDKPDGPEEESKVTELVYEDGTVLRMATGYNSADTGIAFSAKIAGDGVTLADGKTYHTGDLKPTWVELENILKVKFENKYQGKSTKDEFNYWVEQLDQVDMVSGTADLLTEYGQSGALINIAKYIDAMPNFKKYLEENPIVRLSITGATAGDNKGAIYFSPYFDGVNDIERMPLMRVDWVIRLLDGEGAFEAEASDTLAAPAYKPYMPTSGKIAVDVVKEDGSAVETINKDYDAYGNIVAKMNAAGTLTGVEAVNMLREYIDKTYNNYYGIKRSNLFIGQNAAWDADELVALLRCVTANTATLNPALAEAGGRIQGLFSREDANMQRNVDMYRFAGTLFGVRGLESRKDYLYVGTDNELHDARMEEATYVALERLVDMASEGLISEAFINAAAETTATYLENDLGFMHYDYNQTQTVYNKTKLQEGEKYMAVMVPVAHWEDGTPGGVYMRFTESWRSVKTDGWGISAAGVKGDDNKLYAALKLIDYAYSEEGQILMSYGPKAFIKTKADGSYETFNFNGKQMPVIADATFEELWAKASGNYTNYARQYLGSTLSFLKSQAFEYQCTHEVGKEGAGHISVAIGLGTIKHPELALAENPWYTSVPTVLPLTKVQNDQIKTYSSLSNNFSQSKGGVNFFINLIRNGYGAENMGSRAELINTIKDTWGGSNYLYIQNMAWGRDVTYYNSIVK